MPPGSVQEYNSIVGVCVRMHLLYEPSETSTTVLANRIPVSTMYGMKAVTTACTLELLSSPPDGKAGIPRCMQSQH